jgi:hypothetical protein
MFVKATHYFGRVKSAVRAFILNGKLPNNGAEARRNI